MRRHDRIDDDYRSLTGDLIMDYPERKTVTYADKSKNICDYCGKQVDKLYIYEKDIEQPAIVFCSDECYEKYAIWDSGW